MNPKDILPVTTFACFLFAADMRLYEGMLEQFEDKLEIFGHAKMKEEMGNFQKVNILMMYLDIAACFKSP